MNVENKIKKGVKEIIHLLVNEDYHKLETDNRIGVLTSEEIQEAIYEYGEKITIPPEDAFDEMDIFKLDEPQKYCEEYSIDMYLWTNGNKSDLTLSCEATVDENNEVNVSLYSIRVL